MLFRSEGEWDAGGGLTVTMIQSGRALLFASVAAADGVDAASDVVCDAFLARFALLISSTGGSLRFSVALAMVLLEDTSFRGDFRTASGIGAQFSNAASSFSGTEKESPTRLTSEIHCSVSS